MEEVILLCYEALTVMIPTVVLSILFYHRKKRHGLSVSRWWIPLLILFGFYLFGLFHVTGAGTLYDAIRYKLELNINQINLIPFSSDMLSPSLLFSHTILNIILFMPFGFLLPVLWDRYEKVWRVIISGFIVIVVIELSQLLNSRRMDIDDLILNLFGTICGVLLYKLIFWNRELSLLGRKGGNMEMVILVAAAFLCRFLVFDEMGMAGLLYEF